MLGEIRSTSWRYSVLLFFFLFLSPASSPRILRFISFSPSLSFPPSSVSSAPSPGSSSPSSRSLSVPRPPLSTNQSNPYSVAARRLTALAICGGRSPCDCTANPPSIAQSSFRLGLSIPFPHSTVSPYPSHCPPAAAPLLFPATPATRGIRGLCFPLLPHPSSSLVSG